VAQRLAALREEKAQDPRRMKLLRTLARWEELSPSQVTPRLTPREADVLLGLEQGGIDKVIGRRLAISEHAVRYHLKNIYRKLGVHDRLGALSRARDVGLLG
jgi:LuxR family maltose regulon positive regulatory protein